VIWVLVILAGAAVAALYGWLLRSAKDDPVARSQSWWRLWRLWR
jgi:hypothetical protein